MKQAIYIFSKKVNFVFPLVLFLFVNTSIEAQIFPAAPANAAAGNPDAIIPVTGVINAGVFTAQTPEACIEGDNINFSGYGEDPEWRFDIAIPSGSGPITPSCSNIEIRVCRRGDFGQTAEATFVYDELFNEIGLIPGHPLNTTTFDCTDEPICTIITLDPCSFNTQVDDGIWSVSLYTNGSISGNSVGDFCALAAGPQADGDAASCIGDCVTYTQSVAGIFNNQAAAGPMVNSNCIGCNCAFIDYIKMDIAISDTTFTLSQTEQGVGNPITLTPAAGLTCPQDWTVNGGTTGLVATSGTTTFTTSTPGTYTICNNVGLSNCQEQNCKTVIYAVEICDNGIDDDFDGLTDCNDPDCGTSGDCDMCYDEEPAVIYTINSVAGATSYTWTVPSGAVITSTNGDTSITVDFTGASAGLETVKVVAKDPICNQDSVSYYQNLMFCNDPPIAMDDPITTDEDIDVTIVVLSNDSDPDNSIDIASLSNAGLTAPSNGSISIDNITGEIIYSPNLNFNGTDSFEYAICDVLGLCDTATANLTINPIPDPPVAVQDSETTDEDMAVSINASSNDSDVDNNLDPTTTNIACPLCTTPSNGIIANNGNGTFTYTPNQDFFGTDNFIYQICDASGLCDTTVVNITINPLPDPPIVQDDVNATLEDVAVTVAVLSNDTDPENNISPATVNVITPATNGSTIVDPSNGNILYQPNGNYNGIDQFEYAVCDATGLCDTAIVNLTIAPSPDPPVATDDADATNEDSPVTTNVIANDSDPDNDLDPTSISVLATPSNGSTFVNSVTGEITYTPNPNFNGTDSYTYQVCDLTTPTPSCDIATVDITVNPVNDAPIAMDDTDVTDEETPVIIDVTSNDSDPIDPTGNIDPTSVSIIAPPANGTTSVNPLTGEVTYTPVLDFNGTDIFEYQFCDNQGACDTAQVAVNVLPINDPPIAVDDLNFTNEETTVSTTVAGNDFDVDGNLDPLAVSLISNPLNGVANINTTTGQIIYTPSANYNGLDSMEYSICDTDGLCDTATLVIEIFPVTDGVVASDDADATIEEMPVTTNVLANDNDPDNDIDTSSVAITTPSANGTTTVNSSTGEITYTPDPNFNGTVSYSYQVCDLATPTPNCDIAIVFISVDPINDKPVAEDDNYSTPENTLIAMDITTNDDDPDDPLGNIDPTTVSILSNPTNGTASVNSLTGEINYTPDSNYNGTDILTYIVCDDGNPLAALCDTAIVNITIDPVNNQPLANEDAAITDEETPVTVDVASNDFDPTDILGNIDPTTVSIISPPANGTTSVDPTTGAITYTPHLDFYGSDLLQYVICDDGNPLPSQCDTADVIFTINPINDNPIANNDLTNTQEDNPVTIDVASNDDDPNDPLGNIDPTAVSILSPPINGTTSINPTTGAITYTPNPNFNGTDSLTYEICDDGNPLPPNCTSANIYINVEDVNDPPIAMDDNDTTPEETPVEVAVVSNDTDSDGTIDPTSVSLITPSANGTTSIDPVTGDITFTPDNNFNGTTTFEYQVCDDDGACDIAEVTVIVTATNDPPVAVDDANITNEDTPVSTDVANNDSDIDGNLDPTTLTILTNAANGNAIIAAGEINYIPNPDFNGLDSLVYTICDTDGLCDTANLVINIFSISDPINAQNDNDVTAEETLVVTSVLSNDSDADNDIDTSSVAVLTSPTNGTTSVDPVTGDITYTPNPNFNGNDSYEYQVCDLNVPIPNCDNATVFISVDPTNDPPVANDETVTIPEETTYVFDLSMIADDSNDPLGNIDPTTMTLLDTPNNGTFSIDPISGDVSYTPNSNFNGVDSFTYIICDDGNPLPALCDTGLVVINIAPINNQPIALDDNATLDEDTPVTVNVLLNDDDPNDPLGNIDPTSVSILTNPTNGISSVDPVTGAITYTPNPDFNGIDLLEYVVCDDGNPLPAACDTATLNLTINDINDAPIAVDDAETTPEDTPILVAVSGNDSDADGTLDLTDVSIIMPSANGTTSIDPVSGDITFSPNNNFDGVTFFEYQICDNDGACDTAEVEITVTPTNDPPVANDDSNTTNEEATVTTAVTSNDTDVDGNLDPSTTTILTNAMNGTTSVDPINGSIIYTPNNNYNGLDSVEYSICDTDGLCDTAMLVITILSNVDAVVASDDFGTTDEDNPLVTDVLANDNDPDNDIDTSSVAIVSPPSNGTTSVDPTTGEITYTPDPNFNGTDSYSYQVCDLATPIPNCDIATVFATINPINDDLEAMDDVANTLEDLPVAIDVLANDDDPSDPAGNVDPTSVSLLENPTNGVASVNPTTGEITYTPNPNFFGNDTLTYIVCDDGNPLPATCDTAEVIITIDPVNDAPIAIDDTGITDEDIPVTVDVAANDTDPTDLTSNVDPTTVSILENPTNGTASINPTTGEITYTPDSDFYGNDTLSYVICDDGNPLPAACDTAEVIFTINPINDDPIANDDVEILNENTSTIIDVVTNDDDPIDPLGNIDPTTVSILQNPTNGTATVDPVSGEVLFTPNTDFNGTDSLQYLVCDDGNPLPAACDTAMVYFTIDPVNNYPIAMDDVTSTDEDVAVIIDILVNDNDPNDPLGNIDPTTVSILQNPNNGSTFISPTTGILTYSPDANFNGNDTLTYIVCDDGNPLPAACDTAEVVITVNPINDNPIAVDDIENTNEDTPVTVAVATNDGDPTDPNGGVDPTSVSIVSNPTNGTVSVDPTTGDITYDPNPNFNGSDTLFYEICDTGNPLPATCDTAMIILNIYDINDAPIAMDDSETTDEDTPVVFSVSTNDTDLDGTIDPTSVAIVTPSTNGTTSVDPVTGEVTFSPTSDFNGPTTFEYQICDNDGACDTAQVVVNVLPVNDPPVANDDVNVTNEDNSIGTIVVNNDSDIDGNLDITTINVITPPSNGFTVLNAASGEIIYIPNSNFNGIDLLEYTVCDTDGLCDTAEVEITIISQVDAVVVQDDNDNTLEDTPVTTTVLANDFDFDNDLDTSSLVVLTSPANGTTLIDPLTGAITYTPNPNFYGNDSYIYQMCDMNSPIPNCDDATVFISVDPVNDPPIAGGTTVPSIEDSTIVINVIGNTSDPNDPTGTVDPTTVTVITPPTNGTITVDPTTGEVTFEPNPNFNGVDSFIYVICDTGFPLPAACDTGTIVINVNSANDSPVANDDFNVTNEEVSVTTIVATNDTDPEGNIDPTTVTIITPSANATTTVNPTNGAIIYTPNTHFNGLDSVEYSICDTGGLCDTATLVIDVLPIVDPPIAVDDTGITMEDIPLITSVLNNDSDGDNDIDTSSVIISTPPANGITSVDPLTGEITYTPNIDFNGTDNYSYQICDLTLPTPNCDIAEVFITIDPVNDAPTANDDNIIVTEDTPTTFDPTPNDEDGTDPLGNIDPATVVILQNPNNGIANVNPTTGEITFTPNLDFNGTDSLQYVVCDDGNPLPALCDTAMVYFDVQPTNDAPVAIDDVATVDEDGTVAIDVTANDNDPTDPNGNVDPTTVSVLENPMNGTVTVDPVSGEINYSPNPDFNGNDTLTYIVCDDGNPLPATCDTAEVIITVNPINDNPIAIDDVANTDEDMPVTVAVATNDGDPTDPSGGVDPTSVSIVTSPNNGTVSVDPTTGDITYDPDLNFNGTDTLFYEICDTGNPLPATCDTAMVIFNVGVINDAPTANNDSGITPEETPITVDVVSNDTDLDGTIDSTSVVVITNPTNGATSVDPITGEITYTPELDFNGNNTFAYQVCDNEGLCDTALVSIEVTPVNDSPVAIDDVTITAEETTVTATVTGNDFDVDDNLDITSLNIVTPPNNGLTLVNTSTGDITYAPAANFNGLDSLEYAICDTDGLCDTATLVISILQIADAIIANDDGATTDEDMPVVTNVLLNDVDPDGDIDTAGIAIINQPLNGTVSVDPITGDITYTPNPDFNGTDSYTYQVCDLATPTPHCDDAVVNVTVKPINDAPIAIDDDVTTDEDNNIAISVLGNDDDGNDPAGNIDLNTLVVLQNSTNGTTSINPTTGEITYTPDPDFNGVDSFTYVICDDGNPLPALCDTATVTVNVTPINDTPIALDDTATMDEDNSVTVAITLNDGDANDSNGGLDSTSVNIVTNPTNGTVIVDPITGDLTYTPDLNFNGIDSLEYVICDSGFPMPAACDTALVVFTVNDINDLPIVENDSTTTDEDNSVVIDILINDSDLDGTIDPTTVIITSAPPNGTVTVDPVTGEINYEPNPDFNGTDIFSYQVCDDDGGCETAMVTINVTPINDQPVAVDDSNITFEETPIITAVADNDYDVDGNLDATTVAVLDAPSNGFTLINPSSGDITYIPNINTNGVDTFTYTVCDTDGLCDTALVEITVLPVPDDMDANNDFAITDEDISITTSVLANDLDPDNDIDTSSVIVDNPPMNGTVVIDPASGDITYTPDLNFYGNDSYTYQVCDMTVPNPNCDIATVTVTINPINDTLITEMDVATTDEDTPIELDVLANDDDPSDPTGNLNPATVFVNNAPANGTTTVDLTTGIITYGPNPNFYGVDTFTYNICDDGFPMPATCGMDTVIITVLPLNDSPVAVDVTVILSEDNPITFSSIFNDDDPNDPLGNIDPASVSILENPINGTVTVDPNSGEITYEPNPDFNGADTLTYIVCDDGYPLPAACDTAMITFEIAPVNDVPVFVNGPGSPIDSVIITLLEDGADTTCIAFEDIDILTNNDSLTCSIIGNPTNGTATLVNDSCIIYTPNPNFNGTDIVTKVVCDNAGTCDTLYMVYEITSVNDAPIAMDDFNSTLEDNSVGTFVLINDSDVDGNLDPNSITIIDDASNGTTFVNLSIGQILYIPDANFNGNDTLNYSICDTGGLCDTAEVVLLVLPVEDPVDAQDDSNMIAEDSFVITNVLINDVDPDFNIDTSSVTVVGAPTNGTTSVDPITGEITYTPNPDFNGVDIYEYEVCDLANPANCDIAQVVITVTPTNDGPVAVDDVFVGNEDSTFVIAVTSNDEDPTDPAGGIDPTSVNIIVNPTKGTATLDTLTGEITYVPNPNFNGTDTLIYSVCDLGNPLPALCDTAMVIFEVEPVNDYPIAVNDIATVDEDSTLIVNVTANDGDPSDPAGGIDSLSVNIVTASNNGTASVNPTTGEIIYTPNPNFHGTDTLFYEVCDTGNPLPALCDTAILIINIGFVNDHPTFVNGSGQPIDSLFVTTTEDIIDTICLSISDIDVLTNNDSLTCSIISQPNYGTATIINDTCVIYQSNPDFNGMDTLVKVVCDSYGDCDTLVMIYEVNPTNDNPIAVDDEAETHEDNPIEIAVLSNDGDPTDPAGGLDSTSVSITTPPANGTTTVDSVTGTITYEPDLNYFGLDSFSYLIYDTGNPLPALCDTANVVVNVLPDTDEDGVVDVIDVDDDGDGIPDLVENGGTNPTADDDGDGIYNFEDTDCTNCSYEPTDNNGDGIPDAFDFDGDGVPNSYDLDSDRDGIADVIEAGGNDTDGNGMLDGFADVNGNGLADLIDPAENGMPLPMWNTDATGSFNFLDIDSDGDGLVDNIESQPSVGYMAPFNLDLNENGWDDAYDGTISGTPVPLTNTDGVDEPDYMDLDTDNDGLLDSVEGHDANHDGIADTTPAVSDYDGDGLDDAYDLFNGITTINALASNAPIQDTDADTTPDFRDTDSDNDGLSDNNECPAGTNCPDIDSDGIPDYLDLICNEFLDQPLVSISTPVCETDTIIMFVQNEYLTNILNMDTSDIMFYWFNGNGDTLAMQQEDLFAIAANDAMAISPYSVQVTVEGCISPISAPAEVDVLEIPEVTATNAGAICEGEAIQLSAEFFQNATYEWRIEGTTEIIATEREPVLNDISTTTTFEVMVYVTPCMTPGVATTTVEVETLPIIDPVAEYTLNTNCSPTDLMLTANAASSITLTFEWTGPNGFISNEENPVILNVDETFNGAYTLTVTSPMGCEAAGSVSINTITNAPIQPTIVANGFGSCEGEDITLSIPSYSGSNVNYAWLLNGNVVSTGSNILNIPNATFANSGTYLVHVLVDNCELTSPTFELEIASPPNIVVAQPAIVWCANGTEEILLDATVTGGALPYSFEWNGPNNFYSVNEDPILNNVTFETSGSYTVKVIDGNGCQDSISVEVDVIDAPPTPIISSSGQTCEGGTVTLTVQEYAGSLLNYVWETPSGVTTNIAGMNSNELIINPVDISHEGNYILTVIVDSCTTVSDTFTLFLLEQPEAIPSYTIDGDCQSGNLQLFANATNVSGNVIYEWTGPSGFISNAENPFLDNASVSANGAYNLVVTNNNGCSTSESIIITGLASPPETPEILNNNPVCENGIIHLTITQQYPSNATFNWYNSVGDIIGNGLEIDLAADDVLAISPYTVEVEVNGCTSDLSNQTMVEILPIIEVIAFNSSPVCEGDDVQLFATAVPNATYQWFIAGTTTVISNEQNPIITAPNVTTNYFVEVSSDYECLANNNAITSLEVLPNPIISNVTGGGTYCEGETVTLFAEVSEEGSYTWSGPNGFIQNGTTDASSPFSVTLVLTGNISSGTYTLKTTSTLGCESDVETVQVEITPNPITPELTITDAEICEGDFLELNTIAVNGTTVSYDWYFNGAIFSTTNTPTNLISNSTILNTGQYAVQITIDGCSSNISNEVYVNVFGGNTVIEPENNSSSTSPLCEGDDLQFNIPLFQNATYQWFGPAGYTSTEIYPYLENITTANAGDYFAVVTLNGCAVITTPTTTVYINPTPASPTITTNSPICEGSDLVLSVSSLLVVPTDSSMVFTWYAAGTNQLMGTTYESFLTLENATELFNGEYYLVMSENGCDAEPTNLATAEVMIIPPNDADAGEDIEICTGSIINLDAEAPTVGTGFWTSTTGATIANPELPNTEVLYLTVGENIFIWTLSNGACENYDSDTMIVTSTQATTDIADAGLDFDICNLNNVLLAAVVPTTANGVWTQTADQASQGVIISDPNDPNSQILGLENGNTYTFTWTLSEGNCTDFDSDEVVITTYDIPVENAFITMPEYIYLCGAEEVNLEAIAPITATGMWSVNTDALIVNASLNTTIAADLEAGENIFVWSLSNGVCEGYSTDTVYIYIEDLFEANNEHFDIIFNDSLMQANLLENDLLGNVNEWDFSISKFPSNGIFEFDENGVIDYIPNPNFFGSDTLIYRLCNINCPTECDTAMVIFDITGVSASGECFIPNVMTPDGDGVNDFFIVPCLDTYEGSNVTIFNRWGDEVYRATPYNNDWDGTYKGEKLPAGTYFYILDVKINGSIQNIQGFITLFR